MTDTWRDPSLLQAIDIANGKLNPNSASYHAVQTEHQLFGSPAINGTWGYHSNSPVVTNTYTPSNYINNNISNANSYKPFIRTNNIENAAYYYSYLNYDISPRKANIVSSLIKLALFVGLLFLGLIIFGAYVSDKKGLSKNFSTYSQRLPSSSISVPKVQTNIQSSENYYNTLINIHPSDV